jgi:hypothetical protein
VERKNNLDLEEQRKMSRQERERGTESREQRAREQIRKKRQDGGEQRRERRANNGKMGK